MKKLQIHNLQTFIQFLDSIARLSESAILDIENDKISSVSTNTESTIILYGEYIAESAFTGTINVPDIKKLCRVLENINREQIDLIINTNNIEYKSPELKFKYHIFDDNLLTRPGLKVDKIKSFVGDVGFVLDKAQLQQINRGSSFANNTNKIYFYTDGDDLIAELTDQAKRNSDSLSINLGKMVSKVEPLPINFDTFKMISVFNKLQLHINTQHSVLLVESADENIKLKYVITSLTE